MLFDDFFIYRSEVMYILIIYGNYFFNVVFKWILENVFIKFKYLNFRL